MRAIVLTYTCSEAPAESTLVDIGTVLAREGATDIRFSALSDEETAKALLIASKQDVSISHDAKTTPEDQAVRLIGTMFEEELLGDPIDLIVALSRAIQRAKKKPNNAANKAFMNALFILSQPDLCISKKLLVSHNIDESKIAVIRDLYNSVK